MKDVFPTVRKPDHEDAMRLEDVKALVTGGSSGHCSDRREYRRPSKPNAAELPCQLRDGAWRQATCLLGLRSPKRWVWPCTALIATLHGIAPRPALGGAMPAPHTLTAAA